MHRIGVRTTVDHIIIGITINDIQTVTTENRIGTITTMQCIRAALTLDRIRAAKTADHVNFFITDHRIDIGGRNNIFDITDNIVSAATTNCNRGLRVTCEIYLHGRCAADGVINCIFARATIDRICAKTACKQVCTFTT